MSAVPNVSEIPLARIELVLDQFMAWLQQYGETSWDYQTYFASPLGGWAKGLYYRNRLLGTVAVSPKIFSEAFVPSARRFFAPRFRSPIVLFGAFSNQLERKFEWRNDRFGDRTYKKHWR